MSRLLIRKRANDAPASNLRRAQAASAARLACDGVASFS